MIFILIPIYLIGVCITLFAIGFLTTEDSPPTVLLLAFIWPLAMVSYLMIGVFGPFYYCGLQCRNRRSDPPKLKPNVTTVISNVKSGLNDETSSVCSYDRNFNQT